MFWIGVQSLKQMTFPGTTKQHWELKQSHFQARSDSLSHPATATSIKDVTFGNKKGMYK